MENPTEITLNLLKARDEMKAATDRYEAAFKVCVDAGLSLTYLARKLGVSESATRSFAKRRGWS